MNPRPPATPTTSTRTVRHPGGRVRAGRASLAWVGIGLAAAALATRLSGVRPADPLPGSAGPGEAPEAGLIVSSTSRSHQVDLPTPGLPGLSATTVPIRLPPVPAAPAATEPGETGESGDLAVDGEEAESGEGTLAERAAAFSESDPEAGLAWAGRLSTPEEREMAWENLAWGCAGRNRKVALEALEQLPPSESRWRLAAHLASQWAVEHFDDAERWAGSRSNPFERDAALAAVAIGAAEIQPVRAATLVARDLPAGPARDHAVVAVVQRWVQSDPAGAERWVAAFADRPLQAAARAAILATVPPAAQAP